MSMVPCVALAKVFGYEKPGKNGLELMATAAPLQHADMQSLGEHTSVVNATSHCPDSLTNQASTVMLNGHSSPVSTLLEELLIMIFDDVITSESSSCHSRGTRTGWWLSSPRNLASVSRAWKTTVFACPKLWRDVHITPAQSIRALKEQLYLSSPLSIHLTVHQWPFRNPNPALESFSISALATQLQSILSPSDKEDSNLASTSQRVESITINATEYGTFLNFVLQTWTGPGSEFPVLRRVAMNGNACATWSRACFFDGRSAPRLERLEVSNVVLAHSVNRLPWGIGLNLTTLVWSAPLHNRGSLTVSISCFHRIVLSFPSLVTLELHEHVVALEFVTLESLEASGVTPLMHIRDLRVDGPVFPNARAAYVLFHLLPSLGHLVVRGRACTGPLAQRTVGLTLQGLVFFPRVLGWPTVLPNVDDLELECVEDECEEWKTWCLEELESWRQWRETVVNMGRERDATRMRVHMVVEESLIDKEV